MHKVACILCQRDSATPYVAAEGYTVVACVCGFTYLNPQPDAAELAHLYSEEYVPYQQKTAQGTTAAEQWEAAHSAWYYRALRALKRRVISKRPVTEQVDHTSKKTVLDFGYGNGRYLLSTKKQHPLWELYGYDIDPRPLEGITTVSDLDEIGVTFDLIRLNHVLEHVPDPHQTLRQLKGLLREGGELHLEVPNIASWKFTVFRRHYGNLCLPYHLWHFSPETLSRLLGQCGFSIVSLELAGSTKCTVRSLYNALRLRGSVSPYAIIVGDLLTKLIGERRVNTDAIRVSALSIE